MIPQKFTGNFLKGKKQLLIVKYGIKPEAW